MSHRQRQGEDEKRLEGGLRPAHNVQLATDCVDQAVVGVAVSSAGSDTGQLARSAGPRPTVQRLTAHTNIAFKPPCPALVVLGNTH